MSRDLEDPRENRLRGRVTLGEGMRSRVIHVGTVGQLADAVLRPLMRCRCGEVPRSLWRSWRFDGVQDVEGMRLEYRTCPHCGCTLTVDLLEET